MDGRRGYIQADPDDTAFDIFDYLLTRNDIDIDEHNFEYEDVCVWVRKVLAKKPAWADAFIAVRLNGESIREYAARTGAEENNVSQKLRRAEKSSGKITRTVRFEQLLELPRRG